MRWKFTLKFLLKMRDDVADLVYLRVFRVIVEQLRVWGHLDELDEPLKH
jgi:hypothetical protein